MKAHLHIKILLPIVATLLFSIATPLILLAQEEKSGFVPLTRSLPGVENIQSLPEVINALFGLTVGLGALLAVIMIAIGGFQYMASDVVSSKEAARKRILDAIIGLLLILGTVAFFSQINPNILQLGIFDRDDLKIKPSE
jgi:hypothetical protein